MRKHLIWIVVVIVVAAAVVSPAPGGSAAEKAQARKPAYVFGMCFRTNTGMDSQYKAFYQEAIKAFAEKESMDIKIMFYSDPKAYIADLRKGRVDFGISTSNDVLYTALKEKLMEPFVMFAVFGQKSYRNCIYVKKKSGFKKISDLKQKTLLTYDTFESYVSLRDLLKSSPEDYFVLRAGVSAFSSIYAIGLDDTDAIYVADVNIKYFEKSNPGPVKELQEIACSNEMSYTPIFKKKDFPPEVADEFIDYAMNITENKQMKKYAPLLRTAKMATFPARRAGYEGFISLMDKGYKEKWDKSYEQWIKYQRGQ